MIATLRATPRVRAVWQAEGMQFLRPLRGGLVHQCHCCGEFTEPWVCQDGQFYRVLAECPECLNVAEVIG